MSTKTSKEGQAWIAAMPLSTSRQQALLRLLLDRIASDDIYRWLLVSCSLARNAGDEHSDIDAETVIVDDQWPEGLEQVESLLRGIGPLQDLLHHTPPDERGRKRHHFIAIYENNLQLSLMVTPSSWTLGLKPDAIVLYDPDEVLVQPWHPSAKTTTSSQAREWAFLAWLDLTDAAKYLDRGSLWEALDRLEKSRTHAWQLWAIASKLDFATYGVGQVIDDGVAFPPGIESTTASLDASSIRRACLALADVLELVIEAASNVLAFEIPKGMAETARKRYS